MASDQLFWLSKQCISKVFLHFLGPDVTSDKDLIKATFKVNGRHYCSHKHSVRRMRNANRVTRCFCAKNRPRRFYHIYKHKLYCEIYCPKCRLFTYVLFSKFSEDKTTSAGKNSSNLVTLIIYTN
jgi:hypothetical protein